VPKEGNVTYEQQHDVIFKLKYFQLHALLIIFYDTTFFCQICEDLKKGPLVIGIQGQSRNHHQIHDFSNDHVKFEFQDDLFYHDGFFVCS
jgi:hypothetical protein